MLIQTLLFLILTTIPAVYSVRCYQCASSDNLKEDTCGAYKKFDKESHIAVECNSDESHMPGSFCMKLTQQGPKGFIWDGRWRQVIRRCASVADTGVTGVCNWGVYENGVYWEECYCSADESTEDHCESIILNPTLIGSALAAACGVSCVTGDGSHLPSSGPSDCVSTLTFKKSDYTCH